MKATKLATRAIVVALLATFILVSAHAQSFGFQGAVLKRVTNQPIPGLSVSLLHPVLGRSVVVTTNQFGQFFFYNIPSRAEPYYIEVYWGPELVHRSIFDLRTAAGRGLVIYL